MIQTPKVETIGDLFAHSSLYARTFLVYNLPASAVVVREWPSISQKQTRDRFWAKFRADIPDPHQSAVSRQGNPDSHPSNGPPR